MQAQREFPASLNDVKDKFLVQYCLVGPEVKEVGADTFENSSAKDVRQTKLRVVLVRRFAGLIAAMLSCGVGPMGNLPSRVWRLY